MNSKKKVKRVQKKISEGTAAPHLALASSFLDIIGDKTCTLITALSPDDCVHAARLMVVHEKKLRYMCELVFNHHRAILYAVDLRAAKETVKAEKAGKDRQHIPVAYRQIPDFGVDSLQTFDPMKVLMSDAPVLTKSADCDTDAVFSDAAYWLTGSAPN